MAPEDALASIAEVAIGLAGFSGLVAAFGQRSDQPWRSDQKARIVFLVALSFVVITTSMLPSAISGWSKSASLVWGIPMVTCGALTLTSLLVWGVLSRRHGYKLQFPVTSISILSASGTLQLAVLLSGFGVILPYSPALFVLGLLSVLVFCANMFLALLHMTWRD
jgi:hypothetical protein